MDEQMVDDQLKPIYNSSVSIQDVAWRTCWELWMIETGGKRGSEKSVLTAGQDDLAGLNKLNGNTTPTKELSV